MALDILTFTVGQMQENCYLVTDSFSREALIIDPGDAADFLVQRIAEAACQPTCIVATHGHFDHIMAVTDIALSLSLPFLISQKDEFLVTNMRSSARHLLVLIPVRCRKSTGTCLKETRSASGRHHFGW